jgi:hypothetical protein
VVSKPSLAFDECRILAPSVVKLVEMDQLSGVVCPSLFSSLLFFDVAKITASESQVGLGY